MKKALTVFLFLLSWMAMGQNARDKVFLVDRSVKEGTVIKIDATQITFEDKSTPGTRSAIRLATIWKILYSNGYEEVFNQPLPINLMESKEEVKEEKEKQKEQKPSSGRSESRTETPPVKPVVKVSSGERPLLSVGFGATAPVILSPKEWTSASEGLAFRFGGGGEFGLTFNPLKFLGVSLNQGVALHASYLPSSSGSASSEKEMVRMFSLPTSLVLNIYPKKNYVLSAGALSTSIRISNSAPEIANQRLNGFSVGLGKLISKDFTKNHLEISVNYTKVSSSALFQFNLDKDKFPDLGDLKIDLQNLDLVELKLKFHFGVKR